MNQTTGYSGRPLVQKLGIKPGYRVFIWHPPEGYAATLGDLPGDVVRLKRRGQNLDFIQLFSRTVRDLNREFPVAKAAMKMNAMLWVSWPKKSSPLAGELDENIVRQVGLSTGLVDVKVAAIDPDWSGLKFVYRLKDRNH